MELLSAVASQHSSISVANHLKAESDKENIRELSQFGGGDSVTISEEARDLQQAAAAGETGEKKQDLAEGQGQASEEGTPEDGAKAAGGSDAAAKPEEEKGSAQQQAIKRLRQQIKEVQEKLQDAQTRLAQAMSAEKGGNAGEAESAENAEATEAVLQGNTAAMGGQSAVDTVKQEVNMLNEQLLQLQNALAELMKGAGGGGNPMGGFGGGGKNVGAVGGHIGTV